MEIDLARHLALIQPLTLINFAMATAALIALRYTSVQFRILRILLIPLEFCFLNLWIFWGVQVYLRYLTEYTEPSRIISLWATVIDLQFSTSITVTTLILLIQRSRVKGPQDS